MPFPSQPNKPRGRHTEWTEEQLDEMTTPEAMAKAQPAAAEFWRETAPAEFSDLLDATEYEKPTDAERLTL